jgi:methionine aminopeptidase
VTGVALVTTQQMVTVIPAVNDLISIRRIRDSVARATETEFLKQRTPASPSKANRGVLCFSASGHRQYSIIRDIYRASNEQLVPGRTAGDVYRFVVESFAAHGMAYKSMLAGHSAGAWWHQQEPVISPDNPRRLKQGMVIAMEPHDDHWHIQDMFVVGADGPQLISSKFPTNEIFSCQ